MFFLVITGGARIFCRAKDGTVLAQTSYDTVSGDCKRRYATCLPPSPPPSVLVAPPKVTFVTCAGSRKAYIRNWEQIS